MDEKFIKKLNQFINDADTILESLKAVNEQNLHLIKITEYLKKENKELMAKLQSDREEYQKKTESQLNALKKSMEKDISRYKEILEEASSYAMSGRIEKSLEIIYNWKDVGD